MNCALILRNLQIRGLVETEESSEALCQKYKVTMDFIRYLGLKDIEELPKYEELIQHANLERILAETSS